MSPSSQEAAYHEYEVLREFTVDSGEAPSWFDEPGGGVQHLSEKNIEDLLDTEQIGGGD